MWHSAQNIALLNQRYYFQAISDLYIEREDCHRRQKATQTARSDTLTLSLVYLPTYLPYGISRLQYKHEEHRHSCVLRKPAKSLPAQAATLRNHLSTCPTTYNQRYNARLAHALSALS